MSAAGDAKTREREANQGHEAAAYLGTPAREGWVSYCARCDRSIVFRDGRWQHCWAETSQP